MVTTTAHTSSPVTVVSSCKNTSSASRSSFIEQQQPRSTRTLLSRLFRSKSKSGSPRYDGNDDGDEDEDNYGGAKGRRHHAGAHSPILATSMSALHLRDQRPRHHESLDDQQLDSSFYYNKQQQEQPGDCEDLRRCESMPAQLKNFYQQKQQRGSGSYPAAVERFPARKILIQGYLTKLSAHKYWHAKVLV